jgi:hypothetical protein
MRAFASTTRTSDRKPADLFSRGSAIEKNAVVSATASSAYPIRRKASCACGGGCLNCQAKSSDLKVSQPNDAAEIEADRLADKVMRTPSNEPLKVNNLHTPAAGELDAKIKENEEEVEEDPALQRKKANVSASGTGGDSAAAVRGALDSGGSPLDPGTRAFFEPRFGHDLSRVRIHTDRRAAESAHAVGALAYTVGPHIAFAAGQYDRESVGGRFLLAHELAHTIQSGGQGPSGAPPFALNPTPAHDQAAEQEASQSAVAVLSGGKARPLRARTTPRSVYRFEESEKDQIGSFAELIGAITSIAYKHVSYMKEGVTLDWAGFVRAIGGRVILGDKTGLIFPRYLFTCRCGLIDMVHFFETAYVARTIGNSFATELGRESESNSAATSRFAPEDTPSNAMGAFFGSTLSPLTGPTEFIEKVSDYLRICSAVDFLALSNDDKNTIVDYYAIREGAALPPNQNESATPVKLAIKACGAEPDRSFPFVIDKGDPQGKTISSQAAPFSLTGDTEMRIWIFRQQQVPTLKNVPTFEKIRLLDRLLDGWVSDEDVDAFERLAGSIRDAERDTLRKALAPREDDLFSDKQRERVHKAFDAKPVERGDVRITETISNAPARYSDWNKEFSSWSRFAIALDDAAKTLTVIMRLYSAADPKVKTRWAAAVEKKWGGLFGLHVSGAAAGAAAECFRINVDIQWVDSAGKAHYTIAPSASGSTSGGRAGLGGTTGITDWGIADTTDITHEFGHMLGNTDEYFTTNGIDFSHGDPKKKGFRDVGGGIMNNPSENPEPRHYESVRLHAATVLGIAETRCKVGANCQAAGAKPR